MTAKQEIAHPNLVAFSFNGRSIDALPDESILESARRHGLEIPHLCYKEGYRADGNCRACMVEIEGERTLAPSCCRKPAAGMKVNSESERARHSQRMVVELLRADMPMQSASPYTRNSLLDHWADEVLRIHAPRFPAREQPSMDASHPAITVNLDACIQCTRCVRACREEQVNDVIGFAYRGAHASIVFDLHDPLGASTCVSCGECVQACPTGALMPSGKVGLIESEKTVPSVCPYCGVGCQLTYLVKDNHILQVEGRDGPANHSRLCVKGRYGFDYVHHPDRLTQPLIRREGKAKTAELLRQDQIAEYFREASWDEALDFAAKGLKILRDTDGPASLAGFGSAKGSNEEAYLFQKLVRTGFRTNNVDHCTRLCHASSVAALMETIGSGAVSNPFGDAAKADVIVVVGSNTTVNHPVAATFMKNAVKSGKTLIVLDPYRSALAAHAKHHLQFRPDTDVPLLNSLLHTIIAEGLHNREFIAQRTTGFEQLREVVSRYSPESVAALCGVDADLLKEVARAYAKAGAAMIFWGMGVSQHIHGTDNARCLISLALLTGQIGRPGTGLHPLRGQNNVQGASDVGLIPMSFPNYQPVADEGVRARFETLWDCKGLDPRPGLTVVEVMHAIHNGVVKGMYIMGENPAMSDPNLNHARDALAGLRHLVVQDIFFTETAGFADVILPASAFPEKTGSFTNTDRRVQIGRQAIDPPGEARQDLWIIQQMAQRLGLKWNYPEVSDVFHEICEATPSMGGMTWQRLEREDALTAPLLNDGDPGEEVIFINEFPTKDGRGRFVPAEYIHADELPDAEYPIVFTTGRQLEHWHTGSMTRRAAVLNELEPHPVISIHPEDLAAVGINPGEPITLRSRRGAIVALSRVDTGMPRGVVFMAFCYNEAAANLLTNEALDPFGKIPELKFCAVRLEKN
jgi:formate dehydrogenase major subunit